MLPKHYVLRIYRVGLIFNFEFTPLTTFGKVLEWVYAAIFIVGLAIAMQSERLFPYHKWEIWLGALAIFIAMNAYMAASSIYIRKPKD